MNILLHIAAITFGAAAFFTGPDAPRKMFGFGFVAAVAFVLAVSTDPPGKDYGLECDRYSIFARDC